MMPWQSRIAGLFVLILAACMLSFLYYVQYLLPHGAGLPRDPLLQHGLDQVAGITSYVQHVSTDALFPGRRLHIEGVYQVDRKRDAYASVATTTVITPHGIDSSFTLRNISIGSTVYTQVASDDRALQEAFETPGGWSRFSAASIPERFTGVAIPGPILDNVRILEEDGAYLSLTSTTTRDAKTGLTGYTFALASGHKGIPAGTLQALIGHIGNGQINLWLDDDAVVRILAFDGVDYHSTTTVTRIGENLDIAAPAMVIQ